VAAALLCTDVSASDAREALLEALGAEELETLAEETGLEDYGSMAEGFDGEGFLQNLLAETVRAVASPRLLRELAAVLPVVFLLAAARTVTGKPAGSFDAVSLAGACAVMLLLGGGQNGLTAAAETAIYRLQDAANALLPVLGSAALLSGQVTAAAVKYAAAAWFLNALVNLCCGFVLPLIRLYLAAAAAEAAVGGGVMSGVLGFLKWCGATALSALMLAFTLYLSLTAMAANSADAALVRSAKTAVAAALPVVGGIAGDAASSILAAAAVIRQSVGSFGLLAVASILLAPFLHTGVRYLLLKGIALVSSELAESAAALMLRRLSETMALLLGCLGSCALLVFFSVYALLRAAAA
jgi:stage III sporulation protein AE